MYYEFGLFTTDRELATLIRVFELHTALRVFDGIDKTPLERAAR